MVKLKVLFMIAILVPLFGCGITPYRARGVRGDGYADARISENTFIVDMQCNENTPESICEGYLFRRCAELTIDAGYDYFVILSSGGGMKEDKAIVPGYYDTPVGSRKYEPAAPVFQPGYVVKYRHPVARATIKTFRGNPPKDEEAAFNPREILKYTNTGK